MNCPGIVSGFRLAASAAALAMLAQSIFAGLALSGHSAALEAHMINGAAVFLLTVAEVVFATLLRRSNALPRWPLIASTVLLIGQMLQMVSGRFLLLSAHIPLGVGLFGLMTVLACWTWVWRPEPARVKAEPQIALNALREHP
jgi:hypothetical protein